MSCVISGTPTLEGTAFTVELAELTGVMLDGLTSERMRKILELTSHLIREEDV